jgi:periplasmic divalent cation tolerance protein
MMATEILLLITTLPDKASAERIARTLVDERLAACVSVLPSCTSIYRWQGAVETAAEVPLLIKTTKKAYAGLEQRLRECHSYELPEILAIPVVEGLNEYLQWIARETDS